MGVTLSFGQHAGVPQNDFKQHPIEAYRKKNFKI